MRYDEYKALHPEDPVTEVGWGGSSYDIYRSQVPIHALEPHRNARLGNWTIFALESIEKDWNYYSKAWHRSHGPKITVTRRYVRFISDGGQERTVDLESWRGNWLLNAILQAGIVKPRKGQMAVRLHPALDIKLVQEQRGYRFYERQLKGTHWDYCLVSPLGMTYHGGSYRYCLRGLKAKRRGLKLRQEGGVIDWKLLKKLGFCDAGIKEFCSRYGYSLKDTTSPSEVYERIRRRPELARPFQGELRTLAKALSFEAPELA